MLPNFNMFPLLEFDICRIFWKILFLTVLMLFFGVSQVGENQDEAKMIDVKKVPSCPYTKEKWLKDATAKNCGSKNVTFKYHCLLDHWRNQSFVFCGEDKRIIGFYCPEYDETRGRIRENYHMKCIELNPPCPIKYNSSDVFKYPDCIKSNIIDASNTTTKEKIKENKDYNNADLSIAVFFLLMVCIIIHSIMVLLLYQYRYRRVRGKKTFLDDDLSYIFYKFSRKEYYHRLVNTYEDEYAWKATELSELFGYQNPMMYKVKSGLSIKDRAQSELLGTKVSFSQPIQEIKKISSFITKECHLPTLSLSFAKELLCCVNFDDIMLEVESLSREVILNKTIETTEDNDEHGKVYVAEVTVTCEKSELNVNQKNSNDWERFLQADQRDPVKVILVHSNSMRVIEAKLKVYRKYKTVIDSSNLFLQHVYDDVEKISKLSVHNKLTWLSDAVKTFRKKLKYLNTILKRDIDDILTEEYLLKLCHHELSSRDYIIHLKNKTLEETEKIRLGTFQSIIEQLGTTITNHVKSQMKLTNLIHLEFKIRRVLIQVFMSNLAWQKTTQNFSHTQMCEKVARDISGKKSDIFKGILYAIEATDDNLGKVSRILQTSRKELKLINQNKAVETWKKREALRCLQGLESYSSVLKHIAGLKENKPTIKVFLSKGDKKAKKFFKKNNKIPIGTYFEFVNVAEKSKEIFVDEEDVDDSLFPDNKHARTKLSEIIKKHGEKIYAKHSSIVGLDAGSRFFNGKVQPCIVVYSLDKDLIPYGEDPLPTSLEGWHCDVREDIVMFGAACCDCRQITHPNPGCCIGLPSYKFGSAGFLVKSKSSHSTETGFLTAAHVAAKNLDELYNFKVLLSNLETSECRDDIVHPLLPDSTQYQTIGKVKESFFGNWENESIESIGIDAAFVQCYEPRKEELSELQIADEKILHFNKSKVMKRGGSTGETEGLLMGNTCSVCVDKDPKLGGFYFFLGCFSIKSIGTPFFKEGDSGSGVFLLENGKPTKPLGIAFAIHPRSQITGVCRIDKIVELFGLSVCQYEEPMET